MTVEAVAAAWRRVGHTWSVSFKRIQSESWHIARRYSSEHILMNLERFKTPIFVKFRKILMNFNEFVLNDGDLYI